MNGYLWSVVRSNEMVSYGRTTPAPDT